MANATLVAGTMMCVIPATVTRAADYSSAALFQAAGSSGDATYTIVPAGPFSNIDRPIGPVIDAYWSGQDVRDCTLESTCRDHVLFGYRACCP